LKFPNVRIGKNLLDYLELAAVTALIFL